jgi:DNA-binding response OmpR family regulator
MDQDLTIEALIESARVAMALRFRTSPHESRILLALLHQEYVTRVQLGNLVAIGSSDVLVCKLRKKLNLWKLTIHTVHAIGYMMSPADKVAAWKILRGETP